jgi:gliding motility-associated-like protein
MNKIKLTLLAIAMAMFCAVNSQAQIATGNLFLQGKYLEIGAQPNASLGSGIAALPGYHPRTGGAVFLCGGSSPNLLASVYDFGLDGWTVGTPNYMGDYTLPGSPWEGWGIEVNGTREWAYSTNCNLSGGLGVAIGSFTSYTNTGGQAKGTWTGTFLSGQLQIEKEYRIDTLSSAFVVTVKLKNAGATPLNNVYYMRSCDPDQSVPWGGSFTTANTIRFQNDFYHRVMVSATATGGASSTGTPPAAIALGTKDNRAKCLIYNSWPLPTGTSYAAMWAGTVTTLGTTYYTVNSGTSSDIAIGLVFNLCNILPNDSTVFSYAYIYNGATSGWTASLDTAFPEPQLMVNGTVMDSVDTVTTCIAASGIANLDILGGSDKSWSWSKWTWSPGTGLSATTGTSTTLTMADVTAVTTYTITGSDTTHCRQLNKTFLLTVIPVVSASPIARDTQYCQYSVSAPLTANVTGVGTLKWYTTSTGGIGTTTAPIPSTTTVGTTTWWVTQTVAGCESNRVPIKVTINPTYTDTIAVSICPGGSYLFNGVSYTSAGVYPVMFSTTKGCDSLTRVIVTVLPTHLITVYDSICNGDTIQFAGNVYSDSGTHSVSFTNRFGCDSTMILKLKVIPIPTAQIDVYPKANICKGDTIKILATHQKHNVLFHYWDFGAATFVSSGAGPEGIYTLAYPDSGTYIIKLNVENTLCVSDTVKKVIDVQPYPDARIAPFDDNICIDDSLDFEPLNPRQGIIYRWLPIQYFPGQNYVTQTYISGIIDKSRTVTLYALSTYGCMGVDSQYVNPRSCCQFAVPSAFTPNGDGKNDLFRPIGGRFKVAQFIVYNRWGEEVYSSRLLATKGWDGTYKGIPQELGVYYWVVIYECEGQQHIEKGDVTLIR